MPSGWSLSGLVCFPFGDHWISEGSSLKSHAFLYVFGVTETNENIIFDCFNPKAGKYKNMKKSSVHVAFLHVFAFFNAVRKRCIIKCFINVSPLCPFLVPFWRLLDFEGVRTARRPFFEINKKSYARILHEGGNGNT